MKVLELKQWLDNFSENAEVMIASPSHDYWGNIQALEINQVDLATVEYSEYHKSDKVIDGPVDGPDKIIDEYDEDCNPREVVLISR